MRIRAALIAVFLFLSGAVAATYPVTTPPVTVTAKRLPAVAAIKESTFQCDQKRNFCAAWSGGKTPKGRWVPFRGNADGYYSFVERRGADLNEVRVYYYLKNSHLTDDTDYLADEVMRGCTAEEWYVRLTSGEIRLMCVVQDDRYLYGKVVTYGNRAVVGRTLSSDHKMWNFPISVSIPAATTPS